MTLTVEQLARALSAEIRGDGSLTVTGGQSLEESGPGEISFVADKSHAANLKSCRATALFVGKNLHNSPLINQFSGALLLVDDAKLAFLKALERIRPPRPRCKIGISPDATIHPSAKIGSGTNIHPGTHVAEDALIGENCDIYPGVVIGAGTRIGNDVVLYPNVVLYHDVILGDSVIVHAGAVIGADGFGYQFAEGAHCKLPHFGTVRIEDHVEIGANTTIDRALVGETVIGRGSKIDNLVMIAHNCQLGPHNVLASQVGFAGSVTTGSYVVCAGQVGIADHVHIGEQAVLAAQTGVAKSLRGNTTYFGSPALPDREQHKQYIAIRKLPRMREQLKSLQEEVRTLQSQILAISASTAGRDDSASAA